MTETSRDEERRSGPDDLPMSMAVAAQPILDKIREIMPEALEETAEERAERLKLLPPTEVVARTLAQFAQALRDLPPVGMVKQRARIERKVAEFEKTHQQCIERDVARLDFPEDCTCFGTGGRDRCGYPGPRPGEFVLGWRTYCGCPIGQAQKAELELVKAERRRYDREREIAKALGEHMQVPERLRGFTVDSWAEASLARGNPRSVVEGTVRAGRAWLESDDWLVLWGPMGTGKTGFGAGLLSELAARGKTCVFISAPDLLGEIKATFGRKDGRNEEEILRAARTAELLFLDDAGAHYTKEDEGWAQEVLYRIIDHRYNAKLPTVLTCNLAPGAKLAAKLGRRSYDRLSEVSQFVEVAGPSLRTAVLRG